MLLFPNSSDFVLIYKGQPSVYILNYSIPWVYILQFLKEIKGSVSSQGKKYLLVTQPPVLIIYGNYMHFTQEILKLLLVISITVDLSYKKENNFMI